MNLRPYQVRAVDFCVQRTRAFVVAPAGSGKTIIAAAALKSGMQSDSPAAFTDQARIVWLANTREQVQQALDAAERFGVKIEAHCVAAQPDCSSAHVIIVDECHHLPAATWLQTVTDSNAVIWGFSATPFGDDPERNATLKKFFGENNFVTIPRQEVLDGGSITAGEVYVHDLDKPGQFDNSINDQTVIETMRRCRRYPMIPIDTHQSRARWQFTAEAIRNNHKRNYTIAKLANDCSASVLVLVSTVEHGEFLQLAIHESTLVHAKIPKKKRKATIEAFRNGTLRCMIATSLADEGLDVPRAAVLILASGGRSAGKIEQRTGRVMRPHADKDFGTVHDFKDRGASLAHFQFLSRIKTYKKLGYKIHP